MNSSQKLAT